MENELQKGLVYAAHPEMAMARMHVDTCVAVVLGATWIRRGHYDPYMGSGKWHDDIAWLMEQAKELSSGNATEVLGI